MVTDRKQHQAGRIAAAGFSQQIIAVPIYRARAQEQLLRYLSVGKLFAYQPQHFFFPQGQINLYTSLVTQHRIMYCGLLYGAERTFIYIETFRMRRPYRSRYFFFITVFQ